MHEPISTTHIAAHGGIAIFGALVHALDSHRKGKSKTILDFFVLMVMSSFSGVMFALVALSLFPDQVYATTAMAGTGGYLGVEGMAVLSDFIKNKFK